MTAQDAPSAARSSASSKAPSCWWTPRDRRTSSRLRCSTRWSRTARCRRSRSGCRWSRWSCSRSRASAPTAAPCAAASPDRATTRTATATSRATSSSSGTTPAPSSDPALAKSWEFSDGDRVFTIKLREGHKWSDGAPFTADDFVFWYEDIYLNKDSGADPALLLRHQRQAGADREGRRDDGSASSSRIPTRSS